MARTKSKPRQKHYKWLGHIPVYFNDDEVAGLVAYIDGREWDMLDIICVITQKSIGLKIVYDEYNECYHGSLQPKAANHYLRGYTIGTNHADLERLLPMLMYLVVELMEHEAIEPLSTANTNTF